MKAILRKYRGETVESEEVVDLPDNYDGDTIPFVMASNWKPAGGGLGLCLSCGLKITHCACKTEEIKKE